MDIDSTQSIDSSIDVSGGTDDVSHDEGSYSSGVSNEGVTTGSDGNTQHGYFNDLPPDLTISEHDSPGFNSFANAMHGIEAPREFVHEAIKWHNQQAAKTQVALEQIDAESLTQTRAVLGEKWGGEYDVNVSILRNYMRSLPPKVVEGIEYARLSDGTALLNSPEALEWLVSLARKPQVSDKYMSASEEKSSLEKLMRDRSSEYWRGDRSTALQARFRDLVSGGDTKQADAPKDSSKIDAEISKIESFMKSNRKAYDRDNATQARYRELLTQKHGG
jgi:hypothetical protein